MHSLSIAVHLADAAPSYGTSGLTAWIRNNAVTLVILICGVLALWAGKSGNISKGLSIVAGVVIGLGVLGLASGTNATDVANWLYSLFKS